MLARPHLTGLFPTPHAGSGDRRMRRSQQTQVDSAPAVGYRSQICLLALAYFGAAKLGLTLAFANSSVTAVWPPTGLALAGRHFDGVYGYATSPVFSAGGHRITSVFGSLN